MVRLNKNVPKDKVELLHYLYNMSNNGNIEALALAYLINDLCPDDRTTKHVFRCLHEKL